MSSMLTAMEKKKAGCMGRGSLGWVRVGGCYFIERGQRNPDFLCIIWAETWRKQGRRHLGSWDERKQAETRASVRPGEEVCLKVSKEQPRGQCGQSKVSWQGQGGNRAGRPAEVLWILLWVRWETTGGFGARRGMPWPLVEKDLSDWLFCREETLEGREED